MPRWCSLRGPADDCSGPGTPARPLADFARDVSQALADLELTAFVASGSRRAERSKGQRVVTQETSRKVSFESACSREDLGSDYITIWQGRSDLLVVHNGRINEARD